MTSALRAFVLLALVSAVAGCGDQTSPSPTTATAATASTSSAQPDSSPSPSTPVLSSPSPSPILDLATRPFTVLVIGGDLGWRTDSLDVVGVDPVKRTLAFASIPRDTIDVPLPDGGIFSDRKINAFYVFAAKNPTRYPQGPGRATADMVGTVLGIHVDYYAATSFAGFVSLVRALGGVTVNLPKAVVDPLYQVTLTNIGIRFPAGTQHLNPDRALIFVRTREGDSDFERQRRQQLFLLAAGRQVLAKPAQLAALLKAASNLSTDFPLDQTPALLAAFQGGPSSVSNAVLGPKTYESAASCTCGYALSPNLVAMRRLAARFFPWAQTP